MNWIIKKFDALTPHELYAILQLRSEVFGVEQNCVYQDMDNKDQVCFHLMGWQETRLVAYTRLVPPGISYTEPSIGRVVTSRIVRGSGLGKTLVEKSIAEVLALYGKTPIKISAQFYLKKFYESFDFKQSGEIYDEDGI
ncbi:MAG TPA: GNAT family N-acetyltransferase, partial [Chitinophagaceae bacterium]|nr:GNAT family N-acetyltransferase [Chitinophagaceae bacterium]